MKAYAATGRRKNAVARVRLLTPGSGNFVVNKLPVLEYFDTELSQREALRPMEVTDTLGQFDIMVNVVGGGKSGQTGAIRLGIARALVDFNAEFRPLLRKEDLMTRDPRMVERKKYGQKKARKRFQFSKR
ncbi:MAG: 30S ribosomal protein S9 [bacterium]